MNIFDPKNNFEWHDYLKILKRRKWFFIVPSLLVLPFGAWKITSNKPIYESACYIQIQPSSIHLLPSNLVQSLPGVSRPGNAVTLPKHILSKEYIIELIHVLELNKDAGIRNRAQFMKPSFPDKEIEEIVEILLLRMLKNAIRVKNIGPDIIVIKANAQSPEFAYALVNNLSEIYINDSFQRAMSRVQNALSFNEEQIDIYKKKLEEAESNLENFKRNLISNQVENPDLSAESLMRIRDALVAIEITTKEKKDYLEYLQSKLKDPETEAFANSLTIKKLIDKVDEKILEMANLMKRFSWKSPEVININRKINDNREDIKNELESLLKEKYPHRETQILSLHLEKAITLIDLEIQNRKAVALQRQLASFKEGKSQNPSQEITLAKLEAEVANNRRLYNTFLQQYQGIQIEERIAQGDAANRFKILEPPSKPLEPINAGFRMILMMTLIISAGMGTGAVILREYLDNSIRTVNEAEAYFQLPVIGVLPYLGDEAEKSQRKRLVLALVAGGLLVVITLLLLFYFKLKIFKF